jgi:hypothetical protein
VAAKADQSGLVPVQRQSELAHSGLQVMPADLRLTLILKPAGASAQNLRKRILNTGNSWTIA